MFKNLKALIPIIAVLMISFCAPQHPVHAQTTAVNYIQNGNFESGVLSPWVTNGASFADILPVTTLGAGNYYFGYIHFGIRPVVRQELDVSNRWAENRAVLKMQVWQATDNPRIRVYSGDTTFLDTTVAEFSGPDKRKDRYKFIIPVCYESVTVEIFSDSAGTGTIFFDNVKLFIR